MKILYFFNYLNIKGLEKYYKRFKQKELNQILYSLRKSSKKVEIKLYCLDKIRFSDLKVNSEIEPLLREHLNINRNKYENIIKKAWKEIKKIFNQLTKIDLNHLKKILIILEVYIKKDLNDFLEMVEFLKSVIHRENPNYILIAQKDKIVYDLLTKDHGLSNKNILFHQSKVDYYFFKLDKFTRFLHQLYDDMFNLILNRFRRKTFISKPRSAKADVGVIIPRSSISGSFNPVLEELKNHGISHRKVPPELFKYQNNFRDFRFKHIIGIRVKILLNHYFKNGKLKEQVFKKLDFKYKKLGAYLIKKWIKEKLPDILYWYDSIEEEINRCNYKLIITGNEFYSEGKTFLFLCQKYDIPMYFIPIVGIPDDGSEITPFYCDFISVEGKLDKEYLISHGVNPSKVYLRGSAKYESILDNNTKKIDIVVDHFSGKEIKISENRKTILFATNPIPFYSNRYLITSVIKVLKKFEDLQVIIKLHPREVGKLQKRILKELKFDATIVKKVDIFKIINSSDILLTQDSATILDAMVVKTPMIVLDLMNKPIYFSGKYPFNDQKYVKKVYNTNQLFKELESLFYEPEELNNYKKKLDKNIELFLHRFKDQEYSAVKAITSDILRIIRKNDQK